MGGDKDGGLFHAKEFVETSMDESTLPVVSENSDAFKKHMVGDNRSKNDKYIIYRYDGTKKKWIAYKSPTNDFNDFKNYLKPYDIVVNDWHAGLWHDRAVFVGSDGKLRWTNADEGNLGNGDLSFDEQWKEIYAQAKKLPTPKGVTKENTTEMAYASGTLSSTGGPSLINENGLESIITPQGTITSLPAKSGIIPADLTRNLWALGEVAPNLIARLGGNNLQTNNNVATNDNSINVDTLNATFNTTKDFDTQKFWMAVKNETILTKNNH